MEHIEQTDFEKLKDHCPWQNKINDESFCLGCMINTFDILEMISLKYVECSEQNCAPYYFMQMGK